MTSAQEGCNGASERGTGDTSTFAPVSNLIEGIGRHDASRFLELGIGERIRGEGCNLVELHTSHDLK